MVASRRFRADLLYRIDILRIAVPPLRAHPKDIPSIAMRYLNDPRAVLTTRALEKLKDYHWPGNVRQLFNCLSRAVSSSSCGVIDDDHINF